MKIWVKSMEIKRGINQTDKKELRKKILELRDGLSAQLHSGFSSKIKENIISWDIYKECKVLLVFVSYKSEADTLGIISDALNRKKKVYCPKVFGNDMLFYEIGTVEELKKGYMGILEPDEGLPRFDFTGKNILMLMPGSVFDKDGNRIGYGKGYYDRFLMTCEDKGLVITTAGIAFSLQIVEEVPTQPHDYKVDYICTENEIISTVREA